MSPQEWSDGHFVRVTLKDLGLRFQLRHAGGQYCNTPQRGHTDFVVVANNGIHVIDLDFCGCPGRPENYVQLLEMRWWPSTPLSPQTAATMDVLRSFHVLNLEAHVPPTDFYRSLERMTNGQGLMIIPVSRQIFTLRIIFITAQDRLAQFMLMVREW